MKKEKNERRVPLGELVQYFWEIFLQSYAEETKKKIIIIIIIATLLAAKDG